MSHSVYLGSHVLAENGSSLIKDITQTIFTYREEAIRLATFFEEDITKPILKEGLIYAPNAWHVNLEINKPFVRRKVTTITGEHIMSALGKKETLDVIWFNLRLLASSDKYRRFMGRKLGTGMERAKVRTMMIQTPFKLIDLAEFNISDFLKDSHNIERLMRKGFDGAIYMGKNLTKEYRVFDNSQVSLLSVELL